MHSLVAGDPCIKCFCRHHVIACEKGICPNTQGCYAILNEEKQRCCDVCKGCLHNGTRYESGERWNHPQDPCVNFQCQAGIVTTSLTRCHAACHNPLPARHGECCPYCQGCRFKGTDFLDGDQLVLEDDRCVKCQCEGGDMVCEKRACPVLSCPASKMVHKPTSCCPECIGTRKVYDLKGRCLLGMKIHANGDNYSVDACTRCSCNGSTSVCQRESCPPLQCALNLQTTEAGRCCPRCQIAEAVSSCVSGGKKHKEGDVWKLDACTLCECHGGQVRCALEQCTRNVTCPEGYHPDTVAGECCQGCVEDDAACVVHHEPRFRTFDGRAFNFQGSCKYLLAEDCVGGTFSLRVRNDATSRSFSWTKSVFLKLNDTKLVLLPNAKVKVDGEPAKDPFVKPGVLSVTKIGSSVKVQTELGITVTWRDNGLLELTVPPSFKDRLCGLCGNYNLNSTDDFQSRRDGLVNDAAAFGRSWRVGGKRYCGRSRGAKKVKKTELNSKKPTSEPKPKWKKASVKKRPGVVKVKCAYDKVCKAIKGPVFEACRNKVDPNSYFRACLVNVCGCSPTKNCFCRTLELYAHQCSRAGVHLHSWRNATDCVGHRQGHLPLSGSSRPRGPRGPGHRHRDPANRLPLRAASKRTKLPGSRRNTSTLDSVLLLE